MVNKGQMQRDLKGEELRRGEDNLGMQEDPRETNVQIKHPPSEPSSIPLNHPLPLALSQNSSRALA